MLVNKLEITKIDDSNLEYNVNDDLVKSASVFFARGVVEKNEVTFVNRVTKTQLDVKLTGLKVNGNTYADVEEAVKALNAFCGSFKQSGGTGNTPTFQQVLEQGNISTISPVIPEAQNNNEAVNLGQLNTGLGLKADLVSGKVPASQLPSFVDDIVEGTWISDTEFESEGQTVIPESGKLYLDTSTNNVYRWSGTQYVHISSPLSLGETESTAYRGDRGKAAYDHSLITSANPHGTNADQIQETATRVFLSPADKQNLATAYTHSQTTGNPHETKLSFGIKFSVTGLNQTISQGTVFNLMQLINLTDKVVFAGNKATTEYTLVNAGTANALLKLPNINSYVGYSIDVRILGSIGGLLTDRMFNVQIRRANNTVAVPRQVRIPANSSLDNDGLTLTTTSTNSQDNYVTDGIKIVIDNPSSTSSTITLNGIEILINGSI